MAHTPGPWTMFAAPAHDGYFIADGIDHGELSRIATVVNHDDTEGETKANARLIAAAPDLLAACKAAVEYGESCRDMPEFSSGYCVAPDIWEAMKAAIAKAQP